jgi:hypothetical protein
MKPKEHVVNENADVIHKHIILYYVTSATLPTYFGTRRTKQYYNTLKNKDVFDTEQMSESTCDTVRSSPNLGASSCPIRFEVVDEKERAQIR